MWSKNIMHDFRDQKPGVTIKLLYPINGVFLVGDVNLQEESR